MALSSGNLDKINKTYIDCSQPDHFPDANEIILAVNHKNFVAQHVYQKAGYIDNGTRAMGRHGEMFILRKRID